MDCSKFQEQITQLKELYTQAQEQIDQYNKTGDLEKYGYPGLENLDKLTDDTDRILEEHLPDFIDKNPDILKPYVMSERRTDRYLHRRHWFSNDDYKPLLDELKMEVVVDRKNGQLKVIRSGDISKPIPGFNGDVKAGAYLGDDKVLVGGTRYDKHGQPHETKVKILDIKTKTFSKDILGFAHPIKHIARASNGHALVDDKKGVLYDVDLETKTVEPIFQSNTERPFSSAPIALSDDKVLLTRSNSISIFDLQTQKITDEITLDDAQDPRALVSYVNDYDGKILLYYKAGDSSYYRTFKYTPITLDVLKAKIPQIVAKAQGEETE